jgi:hypothetical protein
MMEKVEAQCSDCGNWWRVPMAFAADGPLDSCPTCCDEGCKKEVP